MKLAVHCANLSYAGGPETLAATLAGVARAADQGRQIQCSRIVCDQPETLFDFDGCQAVLRPEPFLDRLPDERPRSRQLP